MSIAHANGIDLHVQELAPPAGTDGTAAVLVHGLLVDNLASWYFSAAPRLARGRRVVMFDLRGHGRSERVAEGYDVATLSADLSSLLDGRIDGPVDLVGHSYGALVALHLCRTSPERVRRLVLVEAPLPPSRLTELRELVNASPEELLEKIPAGLRAGLLGGKRRATRLARALHFLLAESSLVADLAAEQDVPDEELARVAQPVLCIYGARSSCRPVGDRLATVLPDARLVELDGGHYLPLERPAQLAEAVEAFLDG